MQRIVTTLLLLCALAAPLFTAQPARAQATEWNIDEAHSYVYFDVLHIFSTTRGRFEEFSGAFRFDPEQLDASTILLTMDVQSINTMITKRDNHLRSEDFFDASAYPEITFASTAISKGDGEDSYMVEGDLTMKDVTKRITVPMTFHGVTEHPMKKGVNVAGFDVAFPLNRLDYNVGDGRFAKLGVVAEDVNVFVSLELLD